MHRDIEYMAIITVEDLKENHVCYLITYKKLICS